MFSYAYSKNDLYDKIDLFGEVLERIQKDYVDDVDKSIQWENETGTEGYSASDLNLDTQINNQDKNDFWLPNFGEGSQVPE